jgi:prepilin-type N-terminal cleavage/methylation domain-containing protein
MICSSQLRLRRPSKLLRRKRGSHGFTLIEIVVVVLIAGILAAISIPIINNSLRVFALRSAVSALTGIIQSTRYQAIYHGCGYQLAFSAATFSYTVQTTTPAVGTTTGCSAAYAATTPPQNNIPLPGRGIALGASVTIQFHPSGQVVATVGTMAPITLTYPGLPQEQITVSNFGRVNVTP